MQCPSRLEPGSYSLSAGLLLIAPVTSVGTGCDELAKLMSDHILGDVHRNMSASVMDCDGQTNHVRENRAAAGPGLDHAFLARSNDSCDLLRKVLIDKRAIVIPPYAITSRFFF